MTLFRNFFSCVRGHRSHAHRRISSSQIKIKFGEPLHRLCKKESHLPKPIFRLITFLAHEGIQTNDLFRRPGNINHMNVIIKLLAQGKPVQWTEYNLYTCANVAKKYLLNLPGGLFGRKGESMLLATFDWNEEERINEFLEILRNMDPATRELTILIFGILFRMVTYSIHVHQSMARVSPPESAQNLTEPAYVSGITQTNFSRSTTEQSIDSQNPIYRQSILAEAVAKSVAGSLFHTCRDSPDKVERAAKVLEYLILAFPSFDVEFIDFFDQAMNKMSHSISSTISSHDMSTCGSLKIKRKPSGLAASFEMWSESFGKSTSQRSSLKDPDRSQLERIDPDSRRVPHVLFHNVPYNIPSITITGPPDDHSLTTSLSNDRNDSDITEQDLIALKVADVTSFRHFQTRIKSMKRRHQANLKKRSDWFLNNCQSPESPEFRSNNDYNSIVVVTCGGSSICLGQSEPLASGNRCVMVHNNNPNNHSVLLSSYLAASGPDLLQSHLRSQDILDGDSYYSSLCNSNVEMYDDLIDVDLDDNKVTGSSIIDQATTTTMIIEAEAPNSVPLIRRMLPSRSSTTSRKTSIQQQECIAQVYDCQQEEEEDCEFIIDDTQSDCY